MYVPAENSIADSSVVYVETRSEDVAYYLAYTVLRSGRTFNRDQFARPLLAIYIAGLSWNNMDEETRGRIVELSRRLHEKAPAKEYSNQRIALQEIARLPEFKELVEILDAKVDKAKLNDALSLVSGVDIEANEGNTG